MNQAAPFPGFWEGPIQGGPWTYSLADTVVNCLGLLSHPWQATPEGLAPSCTPSPSRLSGSRCGHRLLGTSHQWFPRHPPVSELTPLSLSPGAALASPPLPVSFPHCCWNNLRKMKPRFFLWLVACWAGLATSCLFSGSQIPAPLGPLLALLSLSNSSGASPRVTVANGSPGPSSAAPAQTPRIPAFGHGMQRLTRGLRLPAPQLQESKELLPLAQYSA